MKEEGRGGVLRGGVLTSVCGDEEQTGGGVMTTVQVRKTDDRVAGRVDGRGVAGTDGGQTGQRGRR